MKEKIDKKIDEVIESILAKDPKEITYSEYKILDCRSKDLRYLEEQKKHNEELASIMAKTFGCGFGSLNISQLPEPTMKED